MAPAVPLWAGGEAERQSWGCSQALGDELLERQPRGHGPALISDPHPSPGAGLDRPHTGCAACSEMIQLKPCSARRAVHLSPKTPSKNLHNSQNSSALAAERKALQQEKEGENHSEMIAATWLFRGVDNNMGLIISEGA